MLLKARRGVGHSRINSEKREGQVTHTHTRVPLQHKCTAVRCLGSGAVITAIWPGLVVESDDGPVALYE